ncbi:hypothetical protein BUALT_Bualt03G0211300 [Buddleja alternifolia]|uniref:Uncharacterized protein n=1 Tax=Buddleja alternifolia TaxID=168488 RepID=A0AAV6XVI6_9LAMI|nr:hypothetical protein BUALT_Bualt03G0211300 [Buddleja alternifolia]
MKAANATTLNEFSRCMDEMSQLSTKAAKWFNDKPPQHWSRTFFSTELKCDILLNNGCECFNNKILNAKELSIISMLEWSLPIPKCVHKSYRVETYNQVYGPAIMPINGRSEWKKSDFILPLPPNVGREPGRPPIARRMEVDEVQTKKKKINRGRKENPFSLKREYAMIKCNKYGGEGHNKVNKNCPLFNQKIPTQEDPSSHVSFEDAPPESKFTNHTDPVSAYAQKKLKVRKRKVTSVRSQLEDNQSRCNKKVVKKQKTVSFAETPSTGMSTKTKPPLKNYLKKAVPGMIPSNKPKLQLRDESDEGGINLEASYFVPYPDYLQTTPLPERSSATAPKRPKAPAIPNVPKRPNAPETLNATSSTSSAPNVNKPGPSMFSKLQQGQKIGVNVREPPPFSTRQVIHNLPGSRRETYGTFITKGGKKFVALSDIIKTYAIGNAKDKEKKKV